MREFVSGVPLSPYDPEDLNGRLGFLSRAAAFPGLYSAVPPADVVPPEAMLSDIPDYLLGPQTDQLPPTSFEEPTA